MIAKSLQMLVLVVCIAACAPLGKTMDSPPFAEISTLVERPSAYEGQVVLIRGAAIVEFEGWFICPSAAVIELGSPDQCLWLNVADEVAGKGVDLSRFHLKNVELVGRVNPRFKGHMGLFGSSFDVLSGKVLGHHGKRGFRPPPPGSSANNSFKPNPLRGSA